MVRRSTLEDVFLHLTGRSLIEMSSLTLALRPLEFFFAQYRRIWRGTAVTSVVTPVVYLLALGVGLGVFVDRSTDLPAGVSYLEFVAPGSWPQRRCSSRRSRRRSRCSRRSSGTGSTTRCSRPAACARRHARPPGVLRVPTPADGDGLLRRHHRLRRGRARRSGCSRSRSRSSWGCRSRRRSPRGRHTRRRWCRSSRSSAS